MIMMMIDQLAANQLPSTNHEKMATGMVEINTAVQVVLSQITAANKIPSTLNSLWKWSQQDQLFNPGWIYEIA